MAEHTPSTMAAVSMKPEDLLRVVNLDFLNLSAAQLLNSLRVLVELNQFGETLRMVLSDGPAAESTGRK